MVERQYDLMSTWHLDADPESVWSVIADPDMSWPTWWPGCSFGGPLVRSAISSESPAAVLLATTAPLRFRAALGYKLGITVHPTMVKPPHRIEFDAGGDLVGTGSVALFPAGRDGPLTKMQIEWRVRPTQRWMRLLTPIAAPAFTAAHRHLMRKGERGLRAELAGVKTCNGK
ncbi:SRPBCC family protein [Paeniglutamicibacter antarcticus]|uniref:SRPBCC family protein n=1 Tax=Arthrobacter terrae TaxID=2935737 RepID=A0A931GA99_9MICC|nr:SRPBCC family protein [Arthrobacter terrae]